MESRPTTRRLTLIQTRVFALALKRELVGFLQCQRFSELFGARPGWLTTAFSARRNLAG